MDFDFLKFLAQNENKKTREIKIDLNLLTGCINLFYRSMFITNEVSHDKIKEKAYDVIGSLTLTSILFLILHEEEGYIFNEIIYKISMPQETERTYEEDQALIKYYSFEVLPFLLIGVDITQKNDC